MSLEWDLLKKRKTKPAQTAKKAICAFSRRRAHPPASASRSAGGRKPVQGKSPSRTTGMKYHQGPSRWCSVVLKRSQCSWMK
jgi:hypothetical protein